MSKIVIITGGSSGIGLCTAAALREKDCKVYELSRRDSEVPGITHLKCDITDEEQVKAAVAQVMAENGRIDILINNAGFGISGAVEFTETEDARRLFDVNFFGMVRMQGGGRIVNLSSVAAPVPIPFQTYYSAGKAAVNSYTMALSNEVKPFGITVTAVMPGDIKTGFTAARQKSIVGDEVYGGRISRSVAGMEKDEQTGMDPAKAGEFIAKVALSTGHKPLRTIGFNYRCAVFLTKILPARWLNGLIGMIYAK